MSVLLRHPVQRQPTALVGRSRIYTIAVAPPPTNPSFGDAGTQLQGVGSTMNVDVPDNVAVDDIIVVTAFTDSTATVTGLPSGFAQAPESPVAVGVGGGGEHRLYVMWKRATSADSTAGTYDFTLSASVYRNAQAIRYPGAVTSGDPWDVTNTNIDATAGTASPAVSDTTTVANTLLVWASTNWSGGTWTPPGGFTERRDTGDGVCTVADLVQASAGATGSISGTCTGSDKRTAWLGALKPIGAGGGSSGIASPIGAGTVTANVTQGATATPTGGGTLTSLATQNSTITAAGAGTLAANVTQRGSASPTGAGTLAANVSQRAIASLAAAGTLTAPVVIRATATLAGAGTVSAPTVESATATLTGAGALTADGGVGAIQGVASLTGAGTTSATATQRITATLTGAGTISADGTSGAVQGVATPTGAGTLAALATQRATATAAGTGTLTDTAVQRAPAAVTGAGTLSTFGVIAGSATLAGTATLASPVRQLAPANPIGVGALTATVGAAATATLVGAGLLTGIGLEAVPYYPAYVGVESTLTAPTFDGATTAGALDGGTSSAGSLQ